MEKELDEKVYRMTNAVFEEKMKLLFEIDKQFPYENKLDNSRKDGKKKIAVVYDVDGWAYCNIANEIKKYLSNDFDIDIFPVSVF